MTSEIICHDELFNDKNGVKIKINKNHDKIQRVSLQKTHEKKVQLQFVGERQIPVSEIRIEWKNHRWQTNW